KQSIRPHRTYGLLRRFAPRNDGCHDLRPILKPTTKHEGEQRGFSDFHAPIVHEGRTLDQSPILLRATLFEIWRVIDPQRHQPSPGYGYVRHAARRIVEVRHAVNPGVHVAAIELGKAERCLEYGVEAFPIRDLVGGDSDYGRLHNDHNPSGGKPDDSA